MKFTKELKAKWIAALRSGEYEQVRGQLTKWGGYCCLGVLGNIADFTSDSHCSLIKHDAEGFRSVFLSADTQAMLAEKNDCGESFHQIADYIETNIPAEE